MALHRALPITLPFSHIGIYAVPVLVIRFRSDCAYVCHLPFHQLYENAYALLYYNSGWLNHSLAYILVGIDLFNFAAILLWLLM